MSRDSKEGDGEYRYDPSSVGDADGDGIDPAPLVVGGFVGIAGLLFLVEPVVDPIDVGVGAIRPVALSALFLTTGFLLGAVVYLRRGDRLVGGAHAVAGVGWGVSIAGFVVGSGAVLFLGIAVIVGGMLALAAQLRHYR
ncbi:MAG: hypothetical protein PPP58_03400 [Natronomonas sp.]